jgi:hypothetical protein
LLEYRLQAKGEPEPKVVVSDTATYRSEHAGYASLALRLPDACLSGAEPTPPHCSAWGTALEKALGSTGARVISSGAVFQLEREKSLSTYSAAQELGADVVFVVNAIEAASVTAASGELTEVKAYQSDESGIPGAPVALDDDTRSAFLGYARSARMKQIPDPTVIGLRSRVDTTAIVTKTGESVWFYRRAVAMPTESPQGLRLLFGRLRGGRWTPAAPARDDLPAPDAAIDQGASEEATDGAPPSDADPHAETHLALMTEGAEALATAFRAGSVPAPNEEGATR